MDNISNETFNFVNRLTGKIYNNDIESVKFAINNITDEAKLWLPQLLSDPVIVHRIEMMKLLLDQGINPNVTNLFDTVPPLHIAALCNAHDAIELLLEYGADINYQDDNYKNTALHCVTNNLGGFFKFDMPDRKKQHEYAIQFLLSKGANPFIKNIRGQSAIDIATEYQMEHIINLMTGIGRLTKSVQK